MTPPRVYCDFNTLIDDNTYALNCRGTVDDLQRLGLRLQPGLRLTVYDYDATDSGDPVLLVADAVVVLNQDWGLAARVAPDSFRHEAQPE